MVSTRLVFAVVAALFVLAISVDAAYRKPPFNGSIFGKRSNTITGNFKIYQTLKFLRFFLFLFVSSIPPYIIPSFWYKWFLLFVMQITKSPAEPCRRSAKSSARHATLGCHVRIPTKDIEPRFQHQILISVA